MLLQYKTCLRKRWFVYIVIIWIGDVTIVQDLLERTLVCVYSYNMDWGCYLGVLLQYKTCLRERWFVYIVIIWIGGVTTVQDLLERWFVYIVIIWIGDVTIVQDLLERALVCVYSYNMDWGCYYSTRLVQGLLERALVCVYSYNMDWGCYYSTRLA